MTRPFSHGKKHGKRFLEIEIRLVQNISADLDDLAIHEKHSVV